MSNKECKELIAIACRIEYIAEQDNQSYFDFQLFRAFELCCCMHTLKREITERLIYKMLQISKREVYEYCESCGFLCVRAAFDCFCRNCAFKLIQHYKQSDY